MGVDSTQAPLCSPVLGVTGTGGSGKSSLTDELIGRVLHLFPQARIAVFCTDPTKKKTGGALLGDRIRMNFLDPRRVYMRSLASRQSGNELSAALPQIVREFKKLNFDLLVVESSGIGQSNSQILDLADLSLYVMTAEFGAQSQLEKIDMIDFCQPNCHQQSRPPRLARRLSRCKKTIPAFTKIVGANTRRCVFNSII